MTSFSISAFAGMLVVCICMAVPVTPLRQGLRDIGLSPHHDLHEQYGSSPIDKR